MERFGRYQIIRRIASGGMASVHLGRVVGAGGFERLVAIKLMHPHLAEDEDFVSMFLDEARLAARIRHPNVVGVLDIDRGPSGLFIVMDYVDGAPLNKIIAEQRPRAAPIPLGVLLRLFLDVLAGLHEAHELCDEYGAPLKLVHRDISPANVLVGRDGLARITDFGVATAESRIASTRGGEIKGKIPYMSPEQLMGEKVDRRTDVYAAGCVLWEMLTLRRLFPADDTVIGAVLKGPEMSPAQATGLPVPEHVDRVTMKALARKDERLPSAAAFAEEVRLAAQADGVLVAERNEVTEYLARLLPPEERVSSPDPLESLPFAGAPPGALSSPDLGSSAALTRPSFPGAAPSLPEDVPSVTSIAGTDANLASAQPAGRPPRGASTTVIAVAAALLSAAGVWLAMRAASDDPAPAAVASAPPVVPAATIDLDDTSNPVAEVDVEPPASSASASSSAAPKPAPVARPHKPVVAPHPKPVQKKPPTSDTFRPDRP